MKKFLEKVVFFIAVVVFCYSAYNLYLIFNANYNEKEEIEEIREIIDVPKEEAKEEELEEWVLDFNQLLSINPDTVGYIIVDGTSISYPIVQGKDNDYYLNRTFYKYENYAGAIFMDYSANRNFTDLNTFIYGHNVYHGTMFAELANYIDVNFFIAHPFVHLYTPNGNYKLQVFSAYVDDADSDSYEMVFHSTKEYEDYLAMVTAKSVYDTGIHVNGDESIVTLYTCSFEDENPDANDGYIEDRYYIHCKLVKEF